MNLQIITREERLKQFEKLYYEEGITEDDMPEFLDNLLQQQAEISYQQGIKEALLIVRYTIGSKNNTYQEIKQLLNQPKQ